MSGGETSTVSKHGNPAQFHDSKHPHGQRGTGDSGSPSLLSAVQTNQLVQQKEFFATNHGLADNVVAALEAGTQADVQWSTWGLPPRYPSIERNISEATLKGGNYNRQEYMNVLGNPFLAITTTGLVITLPIGSGGAGSGSHDASVLHEHVYIFSSTIIFKYATV
ncbi:hypothetical protein B296_00049832 [Ensete ventricosum]|uniref:Uncharacterized protein n=1 Tax=Ensete ventricosum TaxID=4639 RepID=A0A426XYR7_ENSVE|nr:hypothetical protein B296_00049832 [Ensete ventricosum]